MMDETPEYIKMCNCPEIQKQWQPAKYDFVWAHGELSSYAATVSVYDGFFVKTYPHQDVIWLPCVEQLLKMLKVHWKEKYYVTIFDREVNDIMNDFIQSVDFAKNYPLLWSCNKLVLVFYMYTIHRKWWTEEGWR